MIGELQSVVLDARDPHALARFYSALLGWPVARVDGDWSISVTARGGG